MESRRHRGRAWRAAFGVLMLYVLALQGLLGGVAATRMSARDPGVICTSYVTDPAEDGDGQGEHETCCSAACRSAQLALSSPDDETIPVGVPALLRERRWLTAQVHGPPSRPQASARPRAPPAAV